MPNEERTCACGSPLVRKSPTGRFPTKCEACKGARAGASLKDRFGARGGGPRKAKRSAAPAAAPEPVEFHTLDAIATLELDFLVGSAFHHLAEFRQGDELANLQSARLYLDRAIAARGGA